MHFIHAHPFLAAWAAGTVVCFVVLCYLCHKAPFLDWHD